MRSMVEGLADSEEPLHRDASRRGPPPRDKLGEDLNNHTNRAETDRLGSETSQLNPDLNQLESLLHCGTPKSERTFYGIVENHKV